MNLKDSSRGVCLSVCVHINIILYCYSKTFMLKLEVVVIVIFLTVSLYFVVLWHELGVSICDPSFSIVLL